MAEKQSQFRWGQSNNLRTKLQGGDQRRHERGAAGKLTNEDVHVDRGRGAFRDDVRPRAAADRAHAQRKALMRAREFLDSLELAREFADGVDARRRVDARVRGTSIDRDLEFPGAFALRLQGA